MKLIPLVAALLASAPALAAPAYTLTKTVPLGAPDRWDYVVFDPDGARVYASHGDRVTVLDARSGAVVGEVTGMPGGTHGIAISTATGEGFTDDGEKREVVAFDLKTLRVTHRIPAGDDADGIARDPVTGHVFVVEGDPATMTVIDPRGDRAVAKINLGEKGEYLAADGTGHVLVAGEANGDLIEVDARTNAVLAHWPTPGCAKPHGLAVDAAGGRAFMGCVNKVLEVVDTRSGRVVAELPIGAGNDAVAWDPVRHRVFSSNGRDGTITVIGQDTPDRYRVLDTVPSKVSGRTMTVDPVTGRLFVVAADTLPPATPGGRPRAKPGSVAMLIFDPVR